MRFTIYKTTNTLNGRFYIGAHQTEDPNDSYLGSGKLLRRAIKKYGRASFVKDVLHDFDTREEMYAKERELVNTEFKRDPGNYNLIEGGDSWGKATDGPGNRGNQRHRELLAEAPEYRKNFSQKIGEANRRAFAEGRREVSAHLQQGHAIEFTEEVRTKISQATSGKKNSQHGTCWICAPGKKPRKIPVEDFSSWEEKGWHRGRSQTPPKPRERQWMSKPGEAPRQVPLLQVASFTERGWARGRSRGGCSPDKTV